MAASSSALGASSGRSEAAAFPLWKSVPTRAFATLGTGILHGTHWAIYAFRGSQKTNARTSPCLVVAHLTKDLRYGSSVECGSLAPALGSDVAPVYTLFGSSYRRRANGPVIGETFLGLSVASSVRSVTLTVEPGKSIFRKTRLLSAQQGTKAHLMQFRYLAIAVPRNICISHIAAQDFLGNVVIDADGNECPLIE
jgi:hypothetical protein